MLGERITDPNQVEEGGSLRGMELLPAVTELTEEKVRRRVKGELPKVDGIFSGISGLEYTGYEIHMGKTVWMDGENEGKGSGMESRAIVSCCSALWDEACLPRRNLHDGMPQGNQHVYGTYVHGIFDKGPVAEAVMQALAEKKGISLEKGVMKDYQSLKERQYDLLADTLRSYLNMEEIYGMLKTARME